MNEPYTLDELKKRFQEQGLDHFVSCIEFDDTDFESLRVIITLELTKPVSVEENTSEDRFNRAMELLDAK